MRRRDIAALVCVAVLASFTLGSPVQAADEVWECTFTGERGPDEHHTYAVAGRDLLDKDQPIVRDGKAETADIRIPIVHRSDEAIVAVRAWPVLSKRLFVGATVVAIDRRTGRATLAQVIVSDKSSGSTTGGTCKLKQ